MTDENVETPSTLRLYYEMAQWRLSEQNRAIESIERKIASSIALSGVLFVLFVGLIALGEGNGQGASGSGVGKTEWAGAVVVGVLFIASVICAAIGYRVQGWQYGPKLSRLGEKAKASEYEPLVEWTADLVADAQRHNEEAVRRKGWWSNAALALAVLSLAVTASIVLVSNLPW